MNKASKYPTKFDDFEIGAVYEFWNEQSTLGIVPTFNGSNTITIPNHSLITLLDKCVKHHNVFNNKEDIELKALYDNHVVKIVLLDPVVEDGFKLMKISG